MPYIYKIANDVNNKIYIGKTLKDVQSRWKEHCRDYLRESEEKRPLYRAMNKYGVNHFSIEVVEECNSEILSDREKYWIEFYGSFKYGYNATLGGDGTRYCDYDLIYALYNQNKTVKEIAQITGYTSDTCMVALESFGICSQERKRRGWDAICKPVAKIDKNTGEILSVYSSIKAAYADLGKQHSGHIAEVCSRKRKTAYGFSWIYI